MTEPEDREVIRRYWSAAAGDFDDEPDHGLLDPGIRQAWRRRLQQWIPPGATRVVDLGCGTGSLSLLLSELGHEVLGVDTSAEMVALARTKVESAGRSADFLVGDIEQPLLTAGTFDAVVCRHVVWTLFEPPDTLERWAELVAPGGRMVLVEGRWFDPSGATYPGGPPAAFRGMVGSPPRRSSPCWSRGSMMCARSTCRNLPSCGVGT